MGIDNNSLRFLAEAQKRGVDYSRTATIGRRNYYRLTPSSVRVALVVAGVNTSSDEVENLFHSDGVYADGLL